MSYPFDWLDQIEDPVIRKIIRENGYIALTDRDCVVPFCEEAIANNPAIVAAYKKGKTQAVGKIVGEVMRRTNMAVEPPEMIMEIITELLK